MDSYLGEKDATTRVEMVLRVAMYVLPPSTSQQYTFGGRIRFERKWQVPIADRAV